MPRTKTQDPETIEDAPPEPPVDAGSLAIAAGMERGPEAIMPLQRAEPPRRRHPADIGIFMSTTFTAMVLALAKAKKEFKPLKVDGEVDFIDKRGKRVHYKYPTLASINDATQEALGKQGLILTSHVVYDGNNRPWVSTMLLHESGEFMGSRLLLPYGGDAKGLGAVMTYARRYAISALLNLSAPGEDNEEAFEADIAPEQFLPTTTDEPALMPDDDPGGFSDHPYGE